MAIAEEHEREGEVFMLRSKLYSDQMSNLYYSFIWMTMALLMVRQLTLMTGASAPYPSVADVDISFSHSFEPDDLEFAHQTQASTVDVLP